MHTAETHIIYIYNKLGFSSSAALIKKAMDMGLK